MKPDRLGGFISYIFITAILILIGWGLYQFISIPVGKIIFAIYCVLAFVIDMLAVIFYTDDDNLI